LKAVLDRLAGRLLTSPAAFFVAGVLDVVLYAAASARRRQAASAGAK